MLISRYIYLMFRNSSLDRATTATFVSDMSDPYDPHLAGTFARGWR